MEVLSSLVAQLAEKENAPSACVAIGALARRSDANSIAIGEVPGIFDTLGALLWEGTSGCREHAVMALSRLAAIPANADRIAGVPGVFESLCALLWDSPPKAKEASVIVLARLARSSETNSVAMSRVPIMFTALCLTLKQGTKRAQEASGAALASLTRPPSNRLMAAATPGIVEALRGALESGTPRMRDSAAATIAHLSDIPPDSSDSELEAVTFAIRYIDATPDEKHDAILRIRASQEHLMAACKFKDDPTQLAHWVREVSRSPFSAPGARQEVQRSRTTSSRTPSPVSQEQVIELDSLPQALLPPAASPRPSPPGPVPMDTSPLDAPVAALMAAAYVLRPWRSCAPSDKGVTMLRALCLVLTIVGSIMVSSAMEQLPDLPPPSNPPREGVSPLPRPALRLALGGSVVTAFCFLLGSSVRLQPLSSALHFLGFGLLTQYAPGSLISANQVNMKFAHVLDPSWHSLDHEHNTEVEMIGTHLATLVFGYATCFVAMILAAAASLPAPELASQLTQLTAPPHTSRLKRVVVCVSVALVVTGAILLLRVVARLGTDEEVWGGLGGPIDGGLARSGVSALFAACFFVGVVWTEDEAARSVLLFWTVPQMHAAMCLALLPGQYLESLGAAALARNDPEVEEMTAVGGCLVVVGLVLFDVILLSRLCVVPNNNISDYSRSDHWSNYDIRRNSDVRRNSSNGSLGLPHPV